MEFVIGAIVLWLIYLALTIRKRREKHIRAVIAYSIINGGTDVRINHIYWESFCSFAVDHGAIVYEDSKFDQDLYRFHLPVEGGLVYVEFARGFDRKSVIVSAQVV